MIITLQALSEAHIPTILEACADWEELARYGAPYWRPRSSAELRRKIADTAGPQPATAYSFVLADSDGRLVGETSIHAIDWRSRVAQVGSASGDRAIGARGMARRAAGQSSTGRLATWGCIAWRHGSWQVTARRSDSSAVSALSKKAG